jgi:hypothetical protein
MPGTPTLDTRWCARRVACAVSTGAEPVSATVAARQALQFVLELAALAALSFVGFHASDEPVVQWLLGVGAPALAIVFWAAFGAPRAPLRARGRWRTLVQVVFFGSASAALAAAAHPALAIGLAVSTAANIASLRRSQDSG